MTTLTSLVPAWLAGLLGARPADATVPEPTGSLHYTIGDALDTPAFILAHGTNNVGVMGAGIAAQIRKRWPTVNRAYAAACKEDDLLGTTLLLPTGQPDGGPAWIANVMTQTLSRVPFPKARHRAVEYDATDAALQDLANQLADRWPDASLTIAMPRIGAGLGGGEWSIIEAIIRSTLVAAGHTVTVYDFNPNPGA